MKDYYRILGIEPDAGREDIRRAYRKRAKTLHPDTSGEGDSGRFLALKEAYEVLYHEESRASYDEIRRAARRGEAISRWNYREFLHGRKDDPASLAKLVCYDLLHDYDDEAVELFDAAAEGGLFSLRYHLDREDFMDFTFLLAEAYLDRGAPVKAYRLLRTIAGLEEEEPYFRHFYQDVLERLAGIVRHPLEEDAEGALRMTFLHDLLTLSYPKREKARFWKLLSELQAARGDEEESVRSVFRAFELDPKTPGVAQTVKVLRDMGLHA